MCAFFGAKTHVVWGKEVREDREFRGKVAKGLYFFAVDNAQVPLSQRGI